MRQIMIFLLLGFPVISHASVIAYWRFEEVERISGGYGRPFSLDEAGNYGIYDPTLYDDVPTTIIPATGESNTHSTTGGYIGKEFGSTPIYLDSQFTIECYLNLPSIIRGCTILSFSGRFAISRLSLSFVHEPETDEEGTVRFRVTSDGNYYFSDPFDFVFGEWLHYAFVQDGNRGGFYINGELWWSFEGELSDYYSWGNWQDYDMSIGSTLRYGLGYLDEFRISNEALKPDQFLCASSVPEPSTMALFGLGAALLARRKRKKNM
jgi:hypothetical protein